jgi:hypothetical protein
MSARNRRMDLGLADGRRLSATLLSEIRDARIVAGISQATAARAAGLSSSRWGRIERSDGPPPNLVELCCIGRALGLRFSGRYFPVGSPVRDGPQLAVLDRFGAVLGSPLRLVREVGLPSEGDPRAWDGRVDGDRQPFFVECESHAGDAQALERRIRLKQRDDPRAGTVILVLGRSDHHRRFLAQHREVFRDLLPADPPSILRALRQGRRPPASGIVLV